MRNNKTLVGIIALALAAMLITTTVGASETVRWRFYSYPADIHVEGTITLENIETDFTTDLSVSEDFTALVPMFVEPGTYEAGFIGKAIASDDSVKFHGVIIVPSLVVPMVRRGSFWANFRVAKPNDFPDGIYIAHGELSITVSPVEPSEAKVIWVHMKGLVTSYGGEQAIGGIMAHARMHEEEDDWAWVHGFLTQQTLATEASEEYTFSFLAFRLVNVTEAALNHEGSDLYISGLWNAFNVTWTYYDHNWTRTIEQIVEKKVGVLNVNLESTGTFTLQIDDDALELIEGSVIFYHIRYGGFMGPRLFQMARVNADCNGDWKVNIIDITKLAKSYGATLGRPGYDFFLDVNFDYEINILDLASTAQAFGQEY
jgi:hypothetical protein